MKNRCNGFGILLLTTAMFAFLACGDGGSSTSTGVGSGGAGGGTGGSGGSESSSSSSGSGGSGGSAGAGGSGGGAAKASPGSELVSGGSVVKSGKYKLIMSFGTSTPGAATANSPNHRLNGGLIGVTEGTK